MFSLQRRNQKKRLKKNSPQARKGQTIRINTENKTNKKQQKYAIGTEAEIDRDKKLRQKNHLFPNVEIGNMHLKHTQNTEFFSEFWQCATHGRHGNCVKFLGRILKIRRSKTPN